ncbi:FAD-dependent oxidoreductase [Syntrophomonas palmitatica]|uniref:FAD-dependent oxidoreductase n=1 Tax=Syntrophomonas palmitatica TaxID=402877 RepID=UPI0006D1B4EC|nr:FAD-dependent oxidoreductase [Syntrophomonas palmitatica]
MICLNIDGKEVKGHQGQTILQIAEANGIKIPTLCHNERLKPYGACGICVVQLQGSPNLIRACATEAQDGMTVVTDNARIRKSRKMTLELLLSDHSGDCRPPCSQACPAETDCQGYVGLIANGQYKEAVALLKESYPIPLSIGMVCPHPCEDACRRRLVEEPVAIANLKAFAALEDMYNEHPYKPEVKALTGKKAAVVGSGPAGLTAAFFLARQGHMVTVYEAMPELGGMLRYGIPEYRLPKKLLDREINMIKEIGVEFVTNTRINRDISLDELRQQYDAIFLGIGAWISSKIDCPGEDLPGVIGGIDFLREVAMNHPVDLGRRVAVIGGGNTAMDAARTAVRLGADEVMVLYRRTRAEMPAEDVEIEEAMEEGVIFHFLVAPAEIIAENGRAAGIRMQKMRLGEPDKSGRRRPEPTGEEELFAVDTIIAAIGQTVNTDGFENLKLSRWGTLEADEKNYQTSLPGVFAGGDGVSGPGIAIEAVAQGQQAARAMNAYLNGAELSHHKPFLVQRKLEAKHFADYERQPREQLHHADPQVRRRNFYPVSQVFDQAKALREASRCLECGCLDYYECKLIHYAREYEVQPERWEGAKHPDAAFKGHAFIMNEPGKCIFCSLCIRTCDEVVGAGALGLVRRGFETMVQPEFGLPLQQTACISCGQCVANCPTGALAERSPIEKQVPLVFNKQAALCSQCAMNCGQIIENYGDMLVRAVPEADGFLCARGRFGWKGPEKDRVLQAMLRKNGTLEMVSLKEAVEQFVRSQQASIDTGAQTAVLVSPSWTLEDAAALADWSHHVLQADKLSSFSYNAAAGIAHVLGQSLSTNRLDQLESSDLVIVLGSFRHSQVAAMKLRQAANKGARLVVISPGKTLMDDLAAIKAIPNTNSTNWLLQILAAIVDQGWYNSDFINNKTNGFEAVKSQLAALAYGEDARMIAQAYSQAQKAMIVIDGYETSATAVQIMTMTAVICGHIAALHQGIIVVTAGGNAAGTVMAGFDSRRRDILTAMEEGRINILVIADEDPVGAGIITPDIFSRVKTKVVLTAYMHDTARLSDIVIPTRIPLELSGHYIAPGAS